MNASPLMSWGRYPVYPQVPQVPSWRHDIPDLLTLLQRNAGTTLAYGSGLSYGDSCLASSNQVISTAKLDRFINADWERGLVRVDAGITLDALLHISIPRGWFVAVTPGTKYVSVGGAIANDVHGKNHHRRGYIWLSRPKVCLDTLRPVAAVLLCPRKRRAI